MARIETWFDQDMNSLVNVRYLNGNIFSQDNAGNLIGVRLSRNGVPYSGGGTVSANVIRADGATVEVPGALSGNIATVVLPQAAYAVVGAVTIIIKLTENAEITTISASVAYVYQSSTDSIIDPGTIIPSIELLIEEIEAAVASIPADYSSLWASLAPVFSANNNYAAGQYVTYDSGIYRFVTPHSGAWAAGDVVAVNIGEEFTGVRKSLYGEAYDNDLLRGIEWINGKYPNPSGSNLIENSGYKTSDYVPVSNGDTIYTNSTTTFLHVYNSSKQWLYGAAMNNSRFVINNANAAFMRVGVGTTVSPNYYRGPSEYTEILDGVSWTDGIYIEGGVTHENAAYKTSDYIFAAPGTVFTKVSVGGCFVNCYNASKTWIAGLTSTNDTFTVSNSDNMYYVRVSIQSALTNPRIFGSFPQHIVYGKAAFDGFNKYAEMLASLSVANEQHDIHIGSGQEYTTLRAGINAAMRFRDTKVYVHPGTYDLEQEFAAELAEATAAHCGITLGAGVHIIFYDGAKVVCNLSSSDYTSAQWAWIAEHFEPFWVQYADRCDFTIENADIETTNTRYCVHDELAGINASYVHKFINCKMKKTTTRAATEFTALQCIGGGIGKNATIIVDGGLYESVWTTSPDSFIPTISYHNGDNASADSSITVKNVYSPGKSFFYFTSYGSSTIESIALVDSCSTGAGVRPVQREGGGTGPVNMKLYTFCNEVRIPGHWENGQYIPD